MYLELLVLVICLRASGFVSCLGILLTHLAHSLAQKPQETSRKPQENETLLQLTKFFYNFILFTRFIFPAIYYNNAYMYLSTES